MKITIAQLNPTVGDIDGNLEKVRLTAKAAKKEKSDLIVFSEMFLCGYPPRDLLKRKWFVRQVRSGLKKVCELSKKFPSQGFLIGAVAENTHSVGKPLFNSAFLIHKGKILFQKNKFLKQ